MYLKWCLFTILIYDQKRFWNFYLLFSNHLSSLIRWLSKLNTTFLEIKTKKCLRVTIRKEVQQKVKKKWNVDSIALSLTNTAVKYGTVYSHPFFSNLLSFWYYTWIFFCKVNITWLKVVDFMITKAVFLI